MELPRLPLELAVDFLVSIDSLGSLDSLDFSAGLSTLVLALDVCDRASDRDGAVLFVLELVLELPLVVMETELSIIE